MRLLCHLYQLEQENLVLSGELPAAELELEGFDPLIHSNGPLQYDLAVQLVNRSILVKGRLELPLTCECVRCLKTFDHEVELTDWAWVLPLEGEERVALHNDCVDLTPYVREDILLAFPQHPLCEPECSGLPLSSQSRVSELTGVRTMAANSSAWAELNKLKL